MLFKRMLMLSPEGDGGSNSQNGAKNEPNPGSNENHNGAAGNGENGAGKQAKTYTQEEVNALLAKEKRQGKNSVLKALGLASVDEGKDFVEKAKKVASEGKTAEEVAAEAINTEKTARIKAENELLTAHRTVAVMKAGFKSEYVDDVVAIASTKVTEEKDFDAVLEDMKKSHQFYLTSNDEKFEAGTGTPAAGFKKSEKKSDEKSYGQRLAESRAAELKRANEVDFFKH